MGRGSGIHVFACQIESRGFPGSAFGSPGNDGIRYEAAGEKRSLGVRYQKRTGPTSTWTKSDLW